MFSEIHLTHWGLELYSVLLMTNALHHRPGARLRRPLVGLSAVFLGHCLSPGGKMTLTKVKLRTWSFCGNDILLQVNSGLLTVTFSGLIKGVAL